MTNHDVVKKLIGNIEPVGETREDEKRLANLIQMCELCDSILTELGDISYNYKDRGEYSIRECGLYADNFIERIKTELNEC